MAWSKEERLPPTTTASSSSTTVRGSSPSGSMRTARDKPPASYAADGSERGRGHTPTNPSAAATQSQGQGQGIPITKLRSLEPALSPSAPLARILSGARDEPEARHPNPYPGRGTQEDPYLVDWLPGERANPYNWGNSYRWTVTVIVSVSTLCIAFGSSAYAAGVGGVMETFDASRELVVSGLSFYVIGE